MLIIGDAVATLVAPRRRNLLCRFDPQAWQRLMKALAERPVLVRVLASAKLGAGLWLALRQLGKE